MAESDKSDDQGPEPMVGFVTFFMALISLLTVGAFGMMVAYTTMYLEGTKTVVLGFIQFSMALIALILGCLASPISQNFYPQFPSLMHPPDRVITFGLWHFALASFMVGDPLFMELRDPKVMKSRPSWVQAMGNLTFATAIALGASFVMGVIGFTRFKNDSRYIKKKDDD